MCCDSRWRHSGWFPSRHTFYRASINHRPHFHLPRFPPIAVGRSWARVGDHAEPPSRHSRLLKKFVHCSKRDFGKESRHWVKFYEHSHRLLWTKSIKTWRLESVRQWWELCMHRFYSWQLSWWIRIMNRWMNHIRCDLWRSISILNFSWLSSPMK